MRKLEEVDAGDGVDVDVDVGVGDVMDYHRCWRTIGQYRTSRI